MDVKDFLDQIKKIDDMIRNKKDEVERLNSVANNLGGFSVGERVQTTRNLHKMTDAIDGVIDLKNEIKSLEAQKHEIISTIEQLSPNEYKVIYRIYVKGFLLKEAAVDLKKSYSWIKNVHQKGLNHLQTIINSL